MHLVDKLTILNAYEECQKRNGTFHIVGARFTIKKKF